MSTHGKRDHGGGLDAAVAKFGGIRANWIDLSTGINPVPYPMPPVPLATWTALPDIAATTEITGAAREFWRVPSDVGILAVPGASAAIAHIPHLAKAGRVMIPGPTYNEHAASFALAGWEVTQHCDRVDASVHVHPNNPDGRCYTFDAMPGDLKIIDESFCDVMPDASLIQTCTSGDTLILKSFGKFWGLAGLRLGFVIGPDPLLEKLADMLGPWPVSGPALHIGAVALRDEAWAAKTRERLTQDSKRMDNLFTTAGAKRVGGTTLFRLYEVDDAARWQEWLAKHHIWSRVFPYNPKWLRMGLPDPAGWDQLENALK